MKIHSFSCSGYFLHVWQSLRDILSVFPFQDEDEEQKVRRQKREAAAEEESEELGWGLPEVVSLIWEVNFYVKIPDI